MHGPPRNGEAPEAGTSEASNASGGHQLREKDNTEGWRSRRKGAPLVRFAGEYWTPEGLNAHFRAQVEQERGCRGVPPTETLSGRVGASESDSRPAACSLPSPPPADPFQTEAGDASLPCRFLGTTQSDQTPKEGKKPIPARLSGHQQKVAGALSMNVAHMVKKHGIDRIGFLTLTFADHVTCAREASRRFNSLASHILRNRYPAYIRVLERQKSGRIHYHLLVVLPDDIRTGADFQAFADRDYKSANKSLRLEWAFWRKTAPVFRFGRTELMPIRSDADALGQYVGKYIGKHLNARENRDKGVRLVSYSKEARMATSKHTNVNKYTTMWRAKVCTFVRMVAEFKPHARVRSVEDLSLVLGKRWAYEWRDFILALPEADLSVPF